MMIMVMVVVVVVAPTKNVDRQRNPELCQRGNSTFHIHVCTGEWSQKERSQRSARTEVSIHSALTTTMSILSLVLSLPAAAFATTTTTLLLLLHLPRDLPTYQPFQGVIKWHRVASFASVCVSFGFSLLSSLLFSSLLLSFSFLHYNLVSFGWTRKSAFNIILIKVSTQCFHLHLRIDRQLRSRRFCFFFFLEQRFLLNVTDLFNSFRELYRT